MAYETPATDWRALIFALRLEAGRLMEDASAELAAALPGADEAAFELGGAKQAGEDAYLLLAAAEVIRRRAVLDGI